MKEQEARDLVTMLAAATSHRLQQDEKAVWEEQFRPLDADLATKTVLLGRNSWKFFPSWAEFREIYNAQKRLSEAHAEQRSDLPEGKRGVVAPEWVHVWYFCRHLRDPKEERSFPQQGSYADPGDTMPMARYEELLHEWIDAGSPKAKVHALL